MKKGENSSEQSDSEEDDFDINLKEPISLEKYIMLFILALAIFGSFMSYHYGQYQMCRKLDGLWMQGNQCVFQEGNAFLCVDDKMEGNRYSVQACYVHFTRPNWW